MESILLKANAKINWSLKVVRRREDGYHELDMLLSSVNLYDQVRITRVPFKGIRAQMAAICLTAIKISPIRPRRCFIRSWAEGRPAG